VRDQRTAVVVFPAARGTHQRDRRKRNEQLIQRIVKALGRGAAIFFLARVRERPEAI
jgi:hypothetical protein